MSILTKIQSWLGIDQMKASQKEREKKQDEQHKATMDLLAKLTEAVSNKPAAAPVVAVDGLDELRKLKEENNRLQELARQLQEKLNLYDANSEAQVEKKLSDLFWHEELPEDKERRRRARTIDVYLGDDELVLLKTLKQHGEKFNTNSFVNAAIMQRIATEYPALLRQYQNYITMP